MCTCSVRACFYDTRQMVGAEFLVVLIVLLLWYFSKITKPPVATMCVRYATRWHQCTSLMIRTVK